MGCGNGKYLGLRSSPLEIRTDTMSSGLLKICKNDRKSEAVRCDCLVLPFKDGTFDAERRLSALHEMLQDFKASGEALICVWAKDQNIQNKSSVYSEQTSKKKAPMVDNNPAPDNFSFIPIHDYDTNFSHNDSPVPWISGSNSTQVYHRFYHVFDVNELITLIKELLPESSILVSYYDQGNWRVRFKKPCELAVAIFITKKRRVLHTVMFVYYNQSM